MSVATLAVKETKMDEDFYSWIGTHFESAEWSPNRYKLHEKGVLFRSFVSKIAPNAPQTIRIAI